MVLKEKPEIKASRINISWCYSIDEITKGPVFMVCICVYFVAKNYRKAGFWAIILKAGNIYSNMHIWVITVQ